ncbi:MAG TPA: hypothetical protein VIL01_15050 [Thermomicrobiales bacterium]
MEFIRLNGTSIRLTGFHQRTVEQVDGPPLQELELVVIVRGSMAHRTLLELLSQGRFQVDLPSDSAESGWTSLEATLVSSYHQSTGGGEAAVHRHDITLRETEESAARRQTAPATANGGESGDDQAKPESEPDEAEQTDEEEIEAPAILVPGDPSVWATALRQLRTPPGAKPASPPEPPLTTAELAGAEAVLVGLRLEALIEQLAATGLVRRSVVDSNFMRLVRERFVQEATPVIGEEAARRAARGVIGE